MPRSWGLGRDMAMLMQKSISEQCEGADGSVTAQQPYIIFRGACVPSPWGRRAWEEAHLLPDL